MVDGNRSDKSFDGRTMGLAPLFKVYSPTLQTLRNEPIISGINDYLTRLKANHSVLKKSIDTIKKANPTASG